MLFPCITSWPWGWPCLGQPAWLPDHRAQRCLDKLQGNDRCGEVLWRSQVWGRSPALQGRQLEYRRDLKGPGERVAQIEQIFAHYTLWTTIHIYSHAQLCNNAHYLQHVAVSTSLGSSNFGTRSTSPNLLRVTCFVSRFRCHMSRVTYHLSHVMCQLLLQKVYFNGKMAQASWWRVHSAILKDLIDTTEQSI